MRTEWAQHMRWGIRSEAKQWEVGIGHRDKNKGWVWWGCENGKEERLKRGKGRRRETDELIRDCVGRQPRQARRHRDFLWRSPRALRGIEEMLARQGVSPERHKSGELGAGEDTRKGVTGKVQDSG